MLPTSWCTCKLVLVQPADLHVCMHPDCCCTAAVHLFMCPPVLQMRVSDMSKQMKQMRGQLESDEQLKSLMAGLRGSNQDESDFADSNVVMNLVEVDRDEQDQLPQVRACAQARQ